MFVLPLLQESWATVFATLPCFSHGGISVSCCSQVHNHLEEQKSPLLDSWKNQAFVGPTSRTFLRITRKVKFNPKDKKKLAASESKSTLQSLNASGGSAFCIRQVLTRNSSF